MSDRELKLNALSRYQKDSPQFILETHDHCEVPAGCGGVVLNWWNPSQGVPIEMWVYATGEYEFFIDGRASASGRPMVSFGQHVLAFRIITAERTQGILMFAGTYDEEAGRPSLSRKTGTAVSILSAAGQGWKYTLSDPGGESWMLPGFDDSNWRGMVEIPVPKPEGWNHHYSRLIARKAQGLAVEPESLWHRLVGGRRPAGSICVRKVFSL
jgi:hypothetical protein